MDYPLKHISLRVPWHDNSWNGEVCGSPIHNSACIKLTNISLQKDDKAEEQIAGSSFADLPVSQFPPCIKERGSFMAPFSLNLRHEHPYTDISPEAHGHILPTPVHYPAFSAPGVPFRWMLRKVIFGDARSGERGLVNTYPLSDISEDHEPDIGFAPNWIQDQKNQRALLECFWNHVAPEKSLVFFYAKEVPLVEEAGQRVLIGVGRIASLGPLSEYLYEKGASSPLRSLIWERMVSHSIRIDGDDGFLLPYHQAQEASENGSNFDPGEIVAFAPEGHFTEFSYATEHVGNDAAISSLLACRNSLHRSAELFDINIYKQEKWIDEQIGFLWEKRGAFPGMGSVLSANGVYLGNFVSQSLQEAAGENGDPWQVWERALREPLSVLPPELANNIDRTISKSWDLMPPERKQFLKLLSRLDVSTDQAISLGSTEFRAKEGILLEDGAYLENPYLFYETTRLLENPISFGIVDRGVFPTPFIRELFPLESPSRVDTAVDGRRISALVINSLEMAASNGDTLKPRGEIITNIQDYGDSDLQPANLTSDLMKVVEKDFFGNEIELCEMADGSSAYQLVRLAEAGKKIRETVEKRIGGKRHKLSIDWASEIAKKFKDQEFETDDEERTEQRAREEKTAALQEISNARASVLIGPAGTGKTTLLSILCSQEEIHSEGVVMLAPTGKARVRMEAVSRQMEIPNVSVFTIAQFLSRSHRYDFRTQRYLQTGEPGEKVGRTVIIDECSMLTEEMLAALLEALSGVHRLILVGDHHQLPPIGAGRPFADIVAHLQPENVQSIFPKVDPNYAELTVQRRQIGSNREDLQLAEWFSGKEVGPGEDEVFEILSGNETSDFIKFIVWDTADELESSLPEVLHDELSFDPDQDEETAFSLSLGGQEHNGYVYFNRDRLEDKVESWQILTPMRQRPWGVEALNRNIHARYKSKMLAAALENPFPKPRRFLKPLGDNQIVYGDKVINNRNTRIYKKGMFPQNDDGGYIANGEIGIVVGQMRTRKFPYAPRTAQVEFSTQPGVSFQFWPGQFGDDSENQLELAYALTIHKAQGSEFNKVFLIIPKSSLMISRELLYTALTRQKKKVIVFVQGSAIDLVRYAGIEFSATASRLTNLFENPQPVMVNDIFLENHLIHRTSRGEAVRSKSEVIVANLLHAHNVDYHYEHPLEIDGVTKFPDFTIEDDDSGVTYYWEHCGMLQDPNYGKRWERKLKWYKQNKILPLDEGGGENGTLIVSIDQENAGINSAQIESPYKRDFRLEIDFGEHVRLSPRGRSSKQPDAVESALVSVCLPTHPHATALSPTIFS